VNAFKTQPIRLKYHITMQEEYLLGMVSMLEPISTTRVLGVAEKQDTMSPATTHKYLMNLHRKRLLCKEKDKEDRRACAFHVSAKGKTLLEELKHAYVRG
jgi:DNA-binding MarR family transcriptional regulator